MTQFNPENLTEDQVISLLQMLFKNLNSLDAIYYDMFINPNAMDVTLERYDENGTLQTLILPNRAKDKIQVLTGNGSPEGVVEANMASFYFDNKGRDLYYKTTATSLYGWTKVLSALNFKAGDQYLTPTGNGQGLTNLNANNITDGILGPEQGGTGTSGLYGILKANGPYNPCTVAVPGEDYPEPISYVGMVAYFACATPPRGWLVADGSVKKIIEYQRLESVIGSTYNKGDEAVDEFRLPDLRGVFARGLDKDRGLDAGRILGSYQDSGVPNISGWVSNSGAIIEGWGGVFSGSGWARQRDDDLDFDGRNVINFNASWSSNVYKDGLAEARPRNIALLACIKY